MATDESSLALANKAALEALGYTVTSDGKVTQQYDLPGPNGVSPGKGTQFVAPANWMTQLSSIGGALKDPTTGGWLSASGQQSTPAAQAAQAQVEAAEPKTGFFSSEDFNPTTGNIESHVNWANALTLAGVLGLGGAAALPALLGGGAASAPADLGAISPAEFGGAAATATPSLAGAGAGSTLGSMVSGAGPLATGETGMAPTEAALQTGADGVTGGLPSTAIGNGMITAAPSSTPSLAMSAPGSTISNMLGKVAGAAPNLSSALGSAAQGIQNNRLQTGTLAGQYDAANLADQTGATAARAGALKQLAQSNYLLNGGFQPQNQSITLNGQTRAIPQIGMAPLPASDAQKAAAANLQTTASGILAPGGTVTPVPFSSYGTPGTGETALQSGAAITSMLPAVKSIYNLFQ